MLEHASITYSSQLKKMGADLNPKVFAQIAVVQAVAYRNLDQGFLERLRFR
jgi:hypothetical protein